MNRYLRQMLLPAIGAPGQARIRGARLLVVGAGGLGCPALQYLVGAGVGRIVVVDPDSVEVSNLHRQPLFGHDAVGRPKAEAARERLAGLNPEVTVEARVAALDPANVASLVAEVDVVLDCADSFAVTYILSDHCLAVGKPLVSAAALGMAGYVGGFCAGAPSVRAVFPDLPAQLASCVSAGVLGPLVGVLGALQAQMALAIVLGMSPSPLGQLHSLDLGNARGFGGFRFDGAAEPRGGAVFIAAAAIEADDYVVELRPEEEAPQPIHVRARRALVEDFAAARVRPAAASRTVLCCRSGLRAWQAAAHLRRYWDGPIALLAAGDSPDAWTGEDS